MFRFSHSLSHSMFKVDKPAIRFRGTLHLIDSSRLRTERTSAGEGPPNVNERNVHAVGNRHKPSLMVFHRAMNEWDAGDTNAQNHFESPGSGGSYQFF